MKEFFTVFAYTFKENVRKKSFIISTVIMLLLAIVALNIPAFMQNSNKDNTAEEDNTSIDIHTTVFIVDEKKVLDEQDLEGLGIAFKGYAFKAENLNNVDALKKTIKESDDSALLIINIKEGQPFLEYWVNKDDDQIIPSQLSKAIKNIYAGRVLKNADISDEIIQMSLNDAAYEVNVLGKGMMQSYFSGILVTILLFFAIYFYGYGVSMSVASEKTSRVMEIILTSVKPSKIIIGKTVAMGFLGLCDLLLLIIVSVVTYKLRFPKDFKIMGETLNLSNFTGPVLTMLIVYFILGYSLYAVLNAVAGATVSKAEDVNSAMMPISMISLIAFYLSYAILGLPEGKFATIVSLIPFSAPFAMPCRLVLTDVPAWEIGVSAAILLASTILLGWISIRIYSSAVLHYGKRLKLKDLLNISK